MAGGSGANARWENWLLVLCLSRVKSLLRVFFFCFESINSSSNRALIALTHLALTMCLSVCLVAKSPRWPPKVLASWYPRPGVVPSHNEPELICMTNRVTRKGPYVTSEVRP